MDFKEPNPSLREVFLARVSASEQVEGTWRYAWEEQSFNPVDGSTIPAPSGRFGTIQNSWAQEINNQELTVPIYVEMYLKGVVQSQLVYEFQAPSAGGSDIAVSGIGKNDHMQLRSLYDTGEVIGSTIGQLDPVLYDPVSRIGFNRYSGLIVSAANFTDADIRDADDTSPVLISILEANEHQNGTVSTTDQSWNGIKYFLDAIHVINVGGILFHNPDCGRDLTLPLYDDQWGYRVGRMELPIRLGGKFYLSEQLGEGNLLWTYRGDPTNVFDGGWSTDDGWGLYSTGRVQAGTRFCVGSYPGQYNVSGGKDSGEGQSDLVAYKKPDDTIGHLHFRGGIFLGTDEYLATTTTLPPTTTTTTTPPPGLTTTTTPDPMMEGTTTTTTTTISPETTTTTTTPPP
jgi:hypothetical protein